MCIGAMSQKVVLSGTLNFTGPKRRWSTLTKLRSNAEGWRIHMPMGSDENEFAVILKVKFLIVRNR